MNILEQFLKITHPDQCNSLELGKFHNIFYHLYWKDCNGRYQACNDTQAKNTGLTTASDLIGLSDYDLYSSQDADFLRENDLSIMESKQPNIFFETGPWTKKNEIANALSIKVPLFTRSKKNAGIIGLSIILNGNISLPVFTLSKTEVPKDFSALTMRQLDCLYYLVLGMTIKEIAKVMKLAPKTIEHYFEKIKFKLSCQTRSELVKKALQISYIKNKLKLL